MGGISQAYGAYQEAEARKMEEQRQMQALQEGANLLQSGSPADVARWNLLNPGLSQQFIQAAQIQDNLTSKPLVDMAKEALSGQVGKREAIENRLSEIESKGGQAENLRALLEQGDPTQIDRYFENTLALYSPKEFQAYKRSLKGEKDKSKTANIQDFEYYQNLKGDDPESATMFAKDVGLLPKDKTMSAAAEKELMSAQQNYYSLSTQSREYELLADDFDRFKDDLPSGATATFSEFIKGLGGTQDEQTELRRRLAKVRLSEALKYLPPGPATDRDVQEAFKGVPKETASPRQVKMFLRGAAKMAAIDAEFEQFKSNYISENENTKKLLTAWKEAIEAGEVASLGNLIDMSRLPESATEQDREAYVWANENPDDPRAKAILNKLGLDDGV
jgi:hypothetical protein